MSLPLYENIKDTTTTLHQFSDALKLLFEPAPTLFERLYTYRQKFNSYTELLNYTQDVLLISLKQVDRMSILNAHPRIGAPVHILSDASKIEQGSDTDPGVLEHLSDLNTEFEQKFPGIRFVTFVNGRPRQDIIPEIKQRMEIEDLDDQVQIGLDAMVDIARDRLEKFGGH